MPKVGNETLNYFGDTFKTKDGWVYILVISNPMWKRLARVMGHLELADDPRFQSDWDRYQNRHLIHPLVDEWVADKTMDEVARPAEEGRVPCGRVREPRELVDDAHVKARELLVNMEVPGVGTVPHSSVAIKFSETPCRIHSPAPSAGEHNEPIFRGLLGLSPGELSQLKEEKAI